MFLKTKVCVRALLFLCKMPLINTSKIFKLDLMDKPQEPKGIKVYQRAESFINCIDSWLSATQ